MVTIELFEIVARFDKDLQSTISNNPSAMHGYLTVSFASRLLGVSASTHRNWDRAAKLPATRHPLNKCRLYNNEDLQRLLRTVNSRMR